MIRHRPSDSVEPDQDNILDEPDAELGSDRPGRRSVRFRRRVMKSTAILPAMFTLGNGLLGFAAIHFATKPPAAEAPMRFLVVSALLIVGAMICDMLDGQLARLTRRTSDFGAQLDSMCDAISFGVAPAVLMLRTAVPALRELDMYVSVERIIWGVAAVYMLCAVLRLARFNVEHDSAQVANGQFNGLPSPAAAAVVVVLVLLFDHLGELTWIHQLVPWVGMGFALPLFTLLAGVLMVSRVPYPHLVNQYIRGKRPFSYIVRIVLIGLAGLFSPYLTAAVLVLAFVVSGPIKAAWRRAHRKPEGELNHNGRNDSEV